ncbi:MAG TPA: fibronectin type III domain-containing protein [Candidatus Limnocylindrales bacterium]
MAFKKVLLGAVLVLSSTGVQVAPARADAAQLTWAPPPLENPVTIQLGTGPTTSNLNDSTDYIIKLPPTIKTGATTISGGRNIHIIGGHIQLPEFIGDPPDAQHRALFITGNKGIVHIEGILIDAPFDNRFGDALAIQSPESIIQVQNSRFVGLRGDGPFFHADIIQPWGGVRELRVDKFTGSSTYQGFFMPRDLGDIGKVTVKRANLTALPELYPGSGGGYMLWQAPNGRNSTGQGPFYNYTDFYVKPRDGRPLGDTIWPNAFDPVNPLHIDASGFGTWPTMSNITGGVHDGAPPGGDFAAAGVPGLGYVSPGYDSTPPQAPANLAATSPFGTEMRLSWNATTDDFGVAGYKLFRDGAEVADLTGTTYLDTGLTPGTGYRYEVRAYDGGRNLSAPGVVSATTMALDTSPPTSPPDLTANAVNTSQVTLRWKPSQDNLGVTGYEIRRNGKVVARIDGTTYTDSGLEAGNWYAYNVFAFDRTGNLSRLRFPDIVRTSSHGPAMPFAQAAIDDAVAAGLTAYTRNGVQSAASQRAGAALYFLTQAAAHDPTYRSTSSVPVSERALAHLRNLTSGGGHEPGCSGGADTAATSNSIRAFAVAKGVPAIWGALTATEKDRITLIVQACLVGSHYVYDDDNDPSTAIDQVSPVDKDGNPSDVAGGTGTGIAAAYFLGAGQANQFLTRFNAGTFAGRLERARLSNAHWVFSQAPADRLKAANEFTFRGHPLNDPFAWVADRAAATFSEPVEPLGGNARGYLLSGSAELPNVCEPGMAVELDGRDASGPRSDLAKATAGWGDAVADLSLTVRFGDVQSGGTASGLLRRYTVATTDIRYKAERGYHSWSAGANRGDLTADRLHQDLGYRFLDQIARELPEVTQPAPAAPDCAPNIALGATVQVTSTLNADSAGAKAVDGNYANASRWVSTGSDVTPTITLNLGGTFDVRNVAVASGFNWPSVSSNDVLVDFTIEAHTAAGWQQVATITGNIASLAATGALDVRADQIRVVVTNPSRNATKVARVYEVVVKGVRVNG